MKHIAVRCVLAIFLALIVASLLNNWLFEDLSSISASSRQEQNIALATATLKDHFEDQDTIDRGLIAQLENEFDLNITLPNAEELKIYDIETQEWGTSDFIEFFDENDNYGQLLRLKEQPPLVVEMWSKPIRAPALAEIFEQLPPILVQLICLCIALFLATQAEKKVIQNILNTLTHWARGDRVEKLHSDSPGPAGEISRKLDELQDYFQQINLSKTDLEVSHQDLLHGVAHEFRSPMARLSFAVDMLADSDATEDSGNLYQNINNSLDEMEQLVKEVLQYSRLQYGDQPSDFEIVSINEMVRSVVSKQKIITPEIVFDTQGSDQKVRVIAHLFDRALLNLVRNASRFAQRCVLISWRMKDGELILSVSDDGIGIPPGKRERVFEPFTRLDASRSRDSGGVGLGLSIVKSICNKHNGIVVADTSPLGGAQFTLRIPQQ
ncbi:MAG: sensor histidine kinase [Halioglobus sp.]